MITAIDGMAGIGKTALAVHAAHRLADRYPDGQLFCDLHAHTPGARPLAPDARSSGCCGCSGCRRSRSRTSWTQRAARWRAELAGRRVLVVLDNAVSASPGPAAAARLADAAWR